VIAVPAVALAATFVASVAVHKLFFLLYVEHFAEDMRIALLLPAEQTDSNVVVVTIDEQTLAKFPYRSPVDRGFLAETIHAIEERGPRAIGIDILFDQPTEPAKDELLRQVIADARVPLVISYVDDPALMTEEQKEFLDDFVPQSMRVLANLDEDVFDTVHSIYPGHVGADGTFLAGFARGLVAKLNIAAPSDRLAIAWHGRPKPEVDPFPLIPAQYLRAPQVDLKGKIVLIGADYSIADHHRTPSPRSMKAPKGFCRASSFMPTALRSFSRTAPPATSTGASIFAIALGFAAFGAWLGGLELELATRSATGFVAVAGFWAVGFFELFHVARTRLSW